MTTAKEVRRRVGDWLIVAAVTLSAVLLLGTIVLTTAVTLQNRSVLQRTHELTLDNHFLQVRSVENHAETVKVEDQIYRLCKTYLPHCPLDKP